MPDNSHTEILVADDDAMSRRVLARLLRAAGYDCRVSKDGSEALEIIRTRPPKLLLLDFDMPGPNGAEVLRRLRTQEDPAIAQMPVIMLTAHGSEQSEVSCLQAGADDFVTKPVNASVLRARIETQLRLRSMRRQLERQNDELEKWRHDLERDLAAARLTQQSLIPQKPPALAGWQVATCYRPVIQVGGDIYGWLQMKDGRILFWIADGTGHGAAAALLTTLAKLLFQHGLEHKTPVSLMEAVDRDFRSIFGARSFMTAMCVALDPEIGRAEVVGAGHPPLLVVRHDGSTQSICSVAPPLGLIKRRPQFTETSIDLKPGDAFLLYTDGLLRWSKDERHRLNPAQLENMLDHSVPSAEALIETILLQTAPDDSINSAKNAPDDIAAVAVRRLAAK